MMGQRGESPGFYHGFVARPWGLVEELLQEALSLENQVPLR